MQFGLLSRLSIFAVFLVVTTKALAVDSTQLWGEGNDYVQLEAVNATNQHPARLNAEQITALLAQFYKREQGKEPEPYFTQDEINRISPQLVRLFNKSKPDQDIEFGTSFRPGGFPFAPRVLNAGRLFIENGQLNLLIGECAKAQDIGYQTAFGNLRKLDHGSRIKATEKTGCELLAGNGTEQVNNRKDWLRLNINAVLTLKVVPVFSDSAPLTFGPATLPDMVHTQAAVQLPSTTNKIAEPLPLAKQPANDVEGRLVLLKQLHDKGLITDAEYEQKRATILKDL